MVAWGPIIGAGISAASSFAGGVLSDRGSTQANMSQYGLSREQLEFQKEAARSGIRWKVADAKAAGIHPLYALGASTFSPSPVSYSPDAGGNVGRGLADAGQHIGRAVQKTMTGGERIALDLAQAQLEGQLLSNDGQRIENRARASQLGPPMAGTPAPGRVGISSTFLDPPTRDSEGNHIIYTAQGALKYPSGFSKAQDVEDTFGDVISEIIMGVNAGDIGLEAAQKAIWDMPRLKLHKDRYFE